MKKAISITLTRLEGYNGECGSVTLGGSDFNLFKLTDMILKEWAENIPRECSYNKCSYIVEFEDGFKYSGNLELRREQRCDDNILMIQMLRTVKFHSGRDNPSHLSKADYQRIISMNGQAQIDTMCRILDTYQIG